MQTDPDDNFRARSDFLTYDRALPSSRIGFELFERLVLPELCRPVFIGGCLLGDCLQSAGISDDMHNIFMCPEGYSFAEIAMFSPLQPTYRAYS